MESRDWDCRAWSQAWGKFWPQIYHEGLFQTGALRLQVISDIDVSGTARLGDNK